MHQKRDANILEQSHMKTSWLASTWPQNHLSLQKQRTLKLFNFIEWSRNMESDEGNWIFFTYNDDLKRIIIIIIKNL